MMARSYGKHICHICSKVPELGFIYKCEQDHLLQIRNQVPSTETLPLIPDHGNFFEAQAEIAKSLGMSASVVMQMRAGEYSYEQVKTLFAQRRNVIEVIKKTWKPATANTPPLPPTPPNKSTISSLSENIIASAGLGIAPLVPDTSNKLPVSSVGTPANTPNTSTANTPKRKAKSIKCNFQVCHACRPYFSDRVPLSVGAVLNDEVPALTEDYMAKLPVRNAAILRDIGLREPAMPKISEKYEDDNELSEGTSATSSGLSEDASEMEEESDAFPCPGTGSCPSYCFSEGCIYDSGFEDSLRAVPQSLTLDREKYNMLTIDRSDQTYDASAGDIEMTSPSGTASNASSISLPEPYILPLTPPSLPFARASSFENFGGKNMRLDGTLTENSGQYYSFPMYSLTGRARSRKSESEVDVEGGVALTEEAVETGVPDIVVHEDEGGYDGLRA